MRNYMPGQHRAFLAYVEKTTNIRDYALSADASSAVSEAYSQAVTTLAKFRDIHIQIVTRYIITPSKSKPADYVKRRTGLNLASASSSVVATDDKAKGEIKERPQLYGTGGTDLIPFLKQTRDETREAAKA
jgi:indoleamine 2,3-dioxygenase